MPSLSEPNDSALFRGGRDRIEQQRVLEEFARTHSLAIGEVNHLMQQQGRVMADAVEQMRQHSAAADVAKQLSAAINQIWATIQQALQPALESLRTLDLRPFIALLPDLREALRRWNVDLHTQGLEGLEAAEFGFVSELIEPYVIWRFALIEPCARGAAATNRMLALLRGPSFQTELRQIILASPVLKRRWVIIEAGLRAHTQRDYLLAIPALLSQMEGTLTDLLILKGLAVADPKAHKVYEVDANGQPKLDKRGRPLEIKGAGTAVARLRLATYTPLGRAAAFVAEVMVDDRNSILHGRDTAYRSPRRSAQTILLISVFAKAVAVLEAQGKTI